MALCFLLLCLLSTTSGRINKDKPLDVSQACGETGEESFTLYSRHDTYKQLCLNSLSLIPRPPSLIPCSVPWKVNLTFSIASIGLRI